MATYHYVGASVLGLTLAIVDTGFEEYRYVFNLVQMKTLFKMGLDLWNVLQVKKDCSSFLFYVLLIWAFQCN